MYSSGMTYTQASKKLTRHPAIGNRPVQRVVVDKSIQHKWVNNGYKDYNLHYDHTHWECEKQNFCFVIHVL